ncbi:MAG: DUF2799 domain-containing protein [Pseudomonadota bacterium]
MTFVFGGCTLLTVAGCAGLTEETCLTGDWNTVGYLDGVNGLGAQKVQDRLKECGRYDVTLDVDGYEAGRQRGLSVFCSPRGALDAGLREVGNINLCVNAPALSRRSYQMGVEYMRAKNSFEYEERQYQSALSSIRQLRRDLRYLRSDLDKEDDEGHRKALQDRIRKKRSKIEYERDHLDDKLFDVRRAERRFRDVERDYDRFLYELAEYERTEALEGPPSAQESRPQSRGAVTGRPAVTR